MTSLAPLRWAVSEALHGAGIDGSLHDELLVVQGELVANAIEADTRGGDADADHDGPRAAGLVRLEVSLVDGVVEYAVCGTAAGEIPPVAEWGAPAPGALRGRGLFIVGQLSDEVEVYQDGGSSLVVSRRRVAVDR